ncbi:hypothetical protein Tco_0548792 [Tanacetum coccineum]
MRELREDTFSGNKNDDAYKHVERVLDIVSLFNIPKVSHDAVMLRVFPIILIGVARRWVDRLPPRTVDSWDLLKMSFIQRYCPSSRNAKQLKEIRNFKQDGDETFHQAWERIGAKYRVDPPGYYTRVDNHPLIREKKPSLEELMSKHLEESTRRRAEMEE